MDGGDQPGATTISGDRAGEAEPHRFDRWSIGILQGTDPLALGPPPGATNPVVTWRSVTDLAADFVADPFLARAGGKWFLFFEALPRDSYTGVIGLAESDDGLRWSYRGTVLREPFHLSYPLVFPWRGEYYMTPETLSLGGVTLYRAAPFPDRWERVGVILPGTHADPTPFRHDGLWWMFTCDTPDRHATLRLCWAGELTGPWHEHPASPIIADDRRVARPAGRVIIRDGLPHRFAQDCDPYYGTRVHAFRITRLTRDEYREEAVGSGPVLGPGAEAWNRYGMHHIDAHPEPAGGWIAAVDGR